MLRGAPGGMNGATSGTRTLRAFPVLRREPRYLRIVIRRVTAIALPALSVALTRTVTLPECP